jgi:hypothetical protein
MAMTTFFKRQIVWTSLMSSNISCCVISLTTIKTSSYYDNYYGRNNNSHRNDDHRRRFNKNNTLCCRTTSTTTVRYAPSNNINTNINNNNKEQQRFIYASRKGDTAGHMVGSSIEKPIRKNDEHVIIKKYRSFKDQWLEETGHSWPSKCSTKSCSDNPTVGAHIFINKKEYAYLVPMCHQCNMDRNNFVPNEIIDDHLRFPIQLDDETPCVELTHLHISEQNTYANIDNPTWLEMSERFIAYTKKHYSPLVPRKYKK